MQFLGDIFRNRNYGRNTVLEAVLDQKISIWINSKLNSLQLILYQCIPNYGEEFIYIKVRFLVKIERLYFFEKHFKIETASQSLYYPYFKLVYLSSISNTEDYETSSFSVDTLLICH